MHWIQLMVVLGKLTVQGPRVEITMIHEVALRVLACVYRSVDQESLRNAT